MSRAELDAISVYARLHAAISAFTRVVTRRPPMARTAWDSHRRDRFDLQQEIGVGEPAQNAQRAGRRLPGEISLQDAARLRHVVGVADEDRDLGDVRDFGAAGGERLG